MPKNGKYLYQMKSLKKCEFKNYCCYCYCINTIINTHILCVFECHDRPEYLVCVCVSVCVFHWLNVKACQYTLFFFMLCKVCCYFSYSYSSFFSFSLSRIRFCWGILRRATLNYSGIKAPRQKTWKKRMAFPYCWILGGNSWEGFTQWPCQEGSLLGIKVSKA